MQDLCHSLILQEESPEASHKIEDLLWKKVYHLTVRVFKQFKETATNNEISLFAVHLFSGVGFYSNLIDVLKKELSMDPAFLDVQTSKRIEKGMQTVHRTMIFEGDLYRYLEETGSHRCLNQAMFWYQQAILWNPSVGIPHNQLGTISSTDNYGLHAIYHYMRW